MKSPLFCNIHAEAQKLWKRSAIRIAVSRPDAVHQSYNRVADAPPHASEMPTALSSVPCMPTCTSPRAGVAPTIESDADMKSS
jgi:hypothetical protein